ncbi:TSC22 domain family protein 1 isoform X5 [Patella vulgata]|uniref:TSC22 domain family protein 1 isoform X5 n=1 Tax=Patella vulgata TaxID=6465 RepID=UPI0024A93BEB|nr:TSC22 domain family protein 1 isoform X5 [Patella vulgata]
MSKMNCNFRTRLVSGTSAVAIDNKIEQAMDLVKSHLMFAVREEVEVLKEQIKELVEKISQLEYENSILRAAATPETLAKLQQQKALPPSSSS